MRIGIWGAGNVGTPLARRLSASPQVSELHWTNRTLATIDAAGVDVQHGLAFAPCCRSVTRYGQGHERKMLEKIDLLVLTLGKGLKPTESDRSILWERNSQLYEDSVVPAVAGFDGIVVVVTNPVDPLTWLLGHNAKLCPHRAIGLGTVVETARLRASLASHLSPPQAAREVTAYVVGMHDEHCVVVAPDELAPGTRRPPNAVRLAREEVVKGARRTKGAGGATVHPIVEGVTAVVEAIASDSRRILTVSSFDPAADLCYSVPCTLGREGVVERLVDGLLESKEIATGLEACRQRLRGQLARWQRAADS